ncbi:unnamed protein product [Protopolystoma xenopodis]|uniref:Uncharacterized protein n=1 Tax=Protopolystoma xenopodis TaxID=117903 RepID=A0A3S5AMI5_9PLAT|nr:unnamed protein product [Protopolystoma xenopodis]
MMPTTMPANRLRMYQVHCLMLGIMTTTMADDFELCAFYIVTLTTRPSCDYELYSVGSTLFSQLGRSVRVTVSNVPSPVSSATIFEIASIRPLAGYIPKRFAGIVNERRHGYKLSVINLPFNRCGITQRPHFVFFSLVPHLFLSTPLQMADPPIHTILCSSFLQRRLRSTSSVRFGDLVERSDDADYDAGETFDNVPSPLSDAGNHDNYYVRRLRTRYWDDVSVFVCVGWYPPWSSEPTE